MATFAIGSLKLERNRWNLAVWAGQTVLAALVSFSGALRLFMPLDRLKSHLVWVDIMNSGWVRFSGFLLLSAAAALVLPPLLGLALRLVPATSIALALAMVITVASHILKARPAMVLVDLAVFALAVFVTWGRTRKVPY